jgi:hypothetical protein
VIRSKQRVDGTLFETHVLGSVTANDGENVLRVEVSSGLFNLNWLRLVPVAAVEQDNGAVNDSHLVQQANGDVRFSLITSSKMEDARVFVKVNGIQVYAGLTLASQNGDGVPTPITTRVQRNIFIQEMRLKYDFFTSIHMQACRYFHLDHTRLKTLIGISPLHTTVLRQNLCVA